MMDQWDWITEIFCLHTKDNVIREKIMSPVVVRVLKAVLVEYDDDHMREEQVEVSESQFFVLKGRSTADNPI
jgi:hypothetical protein